MRHSISSPNRRTKRLSPARKRFLLFQRLESRTVLDADHLIFGVSSRESYDDSIEEWRDWPDFNQNGSNSRALRDTDFSSNTSFLQRNSFETNRDDFDFLGEFQSGGYHLDALEDNAWDREFSRDLFDRNAFQSDRIEQAIPKPLSIATHISESPSKADTPVLSSGVAHHFVVINVPTNDHPNITIQNAAVHVPATSSRSITTAVAGETSGSQSSLPTTSILRTEHSQATRVRDSVNAITSDSHDLAAGETPGLMLPDSSVNNIFREPGTGPVSETANLNAGEPARLPFGLDGMWSFGDSAIAGSAEFENTASQSTEADAIVPSASRSQAGSFDLRHSHSLQSREYRVDSDALSASANNPWPEGMIALDIHSRATEEPTLLAASLDPLALIQMFVREGDKDADHSELMSAIAGIAFISGESELVSGQSWVQWLRDPKLARLASFALGVVAVMTARRSPQTQAMIKAITLRSESAGNGRQ